MKTRTTKEERDRYSDLEAISAEDLADDTDPFWEFLEDVIKDADQCAELEGLYAEQCRENIALQGQNDRLRAGMEKVRQLRDALRDEYPDATMTSKAAVEKLSRILDGTE